MSKFTKIPRERIYQAIEKERNRQDQKWGFPQKNTLPEWGIILCEEVGEAITEINDAHFRSKPQDQLIRELVQVTAVSVAIIEHIAMPVDEESVNVDRKED